MTLRRFATALLFLPLILTGRADAATDCVFAISDTVMKLAADCTTDASIVVPDGMTLNGQGYTITAVDPHAGSSPAAC